MSDQPPKNKYEAFMGYKNPEEDRAILLDARGAKRTQTLFVDVNTHKKYTPLYTMRDQDHKGYFSAYQVYMNAINETDAALKLVGSLDHWNRLCELQWFMQGGIGFTGIEQWRIDMKERDIMIAKENLLYNVKYRGDVSASRALIQLHKEETKKVTTVRKNTQEAKEADKNAEKNNKIAQLHAARIKEDT